MRVKTEEKRQKILEIANALFLEGGFEAISMSDIAAHVGGSKATLYGYFKNKEEIFVAVMMANARKLAEKAFSSLEENIPLDKKFIRFGYDYLNFILSQDMIDMKRRVMAHSDKVDIASQVYKCGIATSWQRVADLIAAGMKKKEIKKGDPWLAAMQLKSLLEADLMTKRLFGIDKKLNKKILPKAVSEALKLFWSYYKI